VVSDPHEAPAALAGRRVLEIADEQGAYCGKLFADMGADVVKIERPGGDASRLVPPFWGDEPHPERSLPFLYANTSKRGVTLDLEQASGREIFRRLAARADVVIETLPPRTLDALGLGWDDLHALRPELVLTSITGFGQSGPRAGWRSSDLVANALGGAAMVTGYAEDPPVRLAGSHAHVMASTNAAAATMIALHHAARTGAGQHVDISIQETMVAVTHICGVGKWLDDGIVPRRAGTGLFASVPSGAYRCRDGLAYLMINRPAHWRALAEWVHEETGNEAILSPLFEGPSSQRLEERELLDVWIEDLTSRHTVREVVQQGQRRHLAFTAVQSAEEVIRDPQLAARGFFVEVGTEGADGVRLPGAPYRHARTPWRIRRPAPRVGEHDVEIYCGELGIGEDELDRLRAEGAI